MSVTTNYSSGNVWLPYVKSYSPLNEEDRVAMQNFLWHEREWRYDIANSPSKTMEFEADGVFREYQIKFNIPLSNLHEIKINNRMFSIDYGMQYLTFTDPCLPIPWCLPTQKEILLYGYI